jgi:DNA polymerase I-like protein with 3'-5' exonuclease and polymerase domains
MHSAMAHAIWKLACNVDQVKKLHPVLRRKAKAVNFGIAFGETAFGLSKNIGCSYEEAYKLINEDFFGVAPTLKSCIDSVHKFVMEEGYVSNIFGRRRHLKDATLEVPYGMRWPDREERRKCYRNTVAPYLIGYNTQDMYKAESIDISNGIYRNELKQFYKCRNCSHLKSCFINSEVGYIKRKIERAKRQSFNMIVQGSAADMTSLSLVWITQELKKRGLDAKVCLYVHDEVAVYAKDEHVDAVVSVMQECMGPRMEKFTNFAVPLVVDTEIKQHWGE